MKIRKRLQLAVFSCFHGSKKENCEKGLKVKADMIKCNYSEPTAFMGRQRKWIANICFT